VKSSGQPRAWSLRRRLAGRILAATTIVWCLVLAAGLAVMKHEMREAAHEALQAQAQFVASLLERAGPSADSDPADSDAAGPLKSETVRMRAQFPGGPAGEAPWPALSADGVREVAGWLVARTTTPAGLAVELGRPLTLRSQEFWEAARVWLAMTVPLLAVLLLVVVRTLSGALAPVATFVAELDQRRASDLSSMQAEGLPEELRPIPRALDRYLVRIEGLLAAERDFSANAAHELRTPLAVAAAQAQIIAEGRGGPRAARAVVAAVAKVTALVERLLELARAEAGIGREGDRCDLLRVLRLLIADLPGCAILLDDGDLEVIEVAADPDAVALVLGNLLRNACEHGMGPVRVTVGPAPSVEIANPVAPGSAFREGRFARGAGSRGSGLGLGIARTTVDRLGWELDLVIRDGAAIARVNFPGCGAGSPLPGPNVRAASDSG
jgi:two-component system OmpR family sensor kinase